MRHLLELLEEGPGMLDGVEEEDEGLRWWHDCEQQLWMLKYSSY
jgi:hypothetical protein